MFWPLFTWLVCGSLNSVNSYNPYHALQGWPTVFPKRFRPLGRSGNGSLFHSPPLQSPVDIRFRRTAKVRLPDLRFVNLLDDDVTMLMENTGHSVRLVVADESRKRPRMAGGPLAELGEFEFDNLHMHWGGDDRDGGEHLVNGKRYAVEGHCVNFNLKYGTIEEAEKYPDGIVVVAFFAKAVECDNPWMEKVLAVLPNITLPHTSARVRPAEAVRWFGEISTPTGYFAYPGSLTTDPHSENVVWIIYPRPMHLSHRQINAFRNLRSSEYSNLEKNARPVQPFNDRPCLFAI